MSPQAMLGIWAMRSPLTDSLSFRVSRCGPLTAPDCPLPPQADSHPAEPPGEGAGELHRPRRPHRRPRRRGGGPARVDAHLLRSPRPPPRPQEGHSQSRRQHLRVSEPATVPSLLALALHLRYATTVFFSPPPPRRTSGLLLPLVTDLHIFNPEPSMPPSAAGTSLRRSAPRTCW